MADQDDPPCYTDALFMPKVMHNRRPQLYRVHGQASFPLHDGLPTYQDAVNQRPGLPTYEDAVNQQPRCNISQDGQLYISQDGQLFSNSIIGFANTDTNTFERVSTDNYTRNMGHSNIILSSPTSDVDDLAYLEQQAAVLAPGSRLWRHTASNGAFYSPGANNLDWDIPPSDSDSDDIIYLEQEVHRRRANAFKKVTATDYQQNVQNTKHEVGCSGNDPDTDEFSYLEQQAHNNNAIKFEKIK